MDQKQVLKNFEKDGFVIIKNVFSLDEIENIRKSCEKLRQGTEEILPADNFSYDEIREFILDERVLRYIRLVLGPKLVYFGESSASFDAHSAPHFHKDARGDSVDPQQNDYPVIRMGVYLQNHKNHSGGLKVRVGSHRHVHLIRRNFKKLFKSKKEERLKLSSFKVGKSYNLPIEAGDLAIWSLRTDHSPNAVRLKIAPNLSVNPKIEPLIPNFMRIPEDKPRVVLFNTFGVDHELHDNYLNQRINKIGRARWLNSSFDSPEAKKLCEKHGIALRFDGLTNAQKG